LYSSPNINLFNSMEQSPSRDADSCLVSQETPPFMEHHVQNTLLVPVLSQMSSVHNLSPCLS